MAGNNHKEPLIVVQDVKKSFPLADGGQVNILKGISFEISTGEFVSIVGPSGNGKSTLLNMMTGIDRPSSGDVIVTGQDLNKLSENQLALWRRHHVGIIFQFFQMLPPLTLLENVILPMDLAGKYSPKERRERAMYLLDRVGLAEQADKLPNAVSGGQQQRAGIARAVAVDPPFIVGDEPTGRLDSKGAEICFELFEEWVADGKTMLMVTHDKALAERVARKIEIVDGYVNRDEYIGVGDWAGS
ncbi:MAG TPA: ABC transporter ATP-binding protein [Anaerolineae bacterium]|nr:ABC transporter ATP-binding protein [Anaerolineae bacterium]MCB0181027.1 ABC transporter ATP-binding protein [Anaerolineae bacterium]MCB0225194.1 ABC transporter ATP-binding protein [Anaerolineae bacterium]MCB9108398.1 ABC transporter ATP-binding protein [Anaerolineales bacterium]HRV96304.1 ABC transporter ATP-binding protein [Anaerolineae bacterium]